MVSNIFKALFLAVAICFVVILYGIYSNMEQTNRYHFQGDRIFDTKTHRTYIWSGLDVKDRSFKKLKKLPD